VSEREKPSSIDEPLGDRLRQIREEVYGDDGVAELSAQLGISTQTWLNYEDLGELAPAQILLRFLELTGADALWLLKGEGERYRRGRSRRPEVGDAGDGSSHRIHRD
jgi:hypothetical protein